MIMKHKLEEIVNFKYKLKKTVLQDNWMNIQIQEIFQLILIRI